MKWLIPIVLSLASLCEGQTVIVEERFKRLPDRRLTLENEEQFPQAQSFKALSKFLEETADKRTLTKWFGEPTLLARHIDRNQTPLPKDYVTTHLLQDPFANGGSGGLASFVRESYFFSIKGTNLGILFQRSAHAKPSVEDPFKSGSQWWSSGTFLAKWPQEKLGLYKDFPTEQLNKWENQQTTDVLKILWKKLAEDLKQ
ncbi:MAG: hypothetical protein ACSHYB_13145 [Roseibacillus sp.]